MSNLTDEQLAKCREAFVIKHYVDDPCPTIKFDGGYIEIHGDRQDAEEFLSAILQAAWSAAQAQWLPIETLPLKECLGYAVSDTVLMAIWFDETGITNIKSGRVWEEHGKRSLPDNRHSTYERVTHWMPLPTPPTQPSGGEAGE